MAVKFPLEMKNGVMARNISEVRENFDIEKIVSYFLDGKLLTWLEARYYEEEAEAMSALTKDDTQLVKKLHQIFGVEYVEEKEVDTEEIARRNEKIAKLKQYTDDVEIINNVDYVAFDQEELAEIYDKGITKIYLCAGEFVIPKSKRNLEYVEIGECRVNGLEKKEDVELEKIKDELIRVKNVLAELMSHKDIPLDLMQLSSVKDILSDEYVEGETVKQSNEVDRIVTGRNTALSIVIEHSKKIFG